MREFPREDIWQSRLPLPVVVDELDEPPGGATQRDDEGITPPMSTEICVRIPDGIDIKQAIGEISHLALLYGSDVRIRGLNDSPPPPVGTVAGPVPQEMQYRDLDVEAGSTAIDPSLTPAGGNRRGNRRG